MGLFLMTVKSNRRNASVSVSLLSSLFFTWLRTRRSTPFRRQPPKVKAFLGVLAGLAALVLLRFVVHDHDNLFVAAEAVHSAGISVLIYKLMKEKTFAAPGMTAFSRAKQICLSIRS